jgi:cytochrome bd ubiquinol oxidase subunit II
MRLQVLWFAAIGLLWTGYFLLEGFDFGVGMLLPVLGRTETERRVLINTIGPVWDGNEVWLIVAGGATFAAFPLWYATMFSGFYLALLVILVALILRGVAFEFRGKVDSPRWRAAWDRAITFGSLVPAVLWGVAFGNLIRGVPINRRFEYTGGLGGLVNGYAILGGLTTLTLFLLHGAAFVALKTSGDIRVRARRVAAGAGTVAVVLAVVFLAWVQRSRGDAATAVTGVLAAAALLGALLVNRFGREGWAFALTGTTIVLATATLFLALFPDVMPSTTNPAFSLTVDNASSSHYTLTIMTWVAAIFLPVVLAYQGWTYWVLSRRLGVGSIPAADVPARTDARHARAS